MALGILLLFVVGCAHARPGNALGVQASSKLPSSRTSHVLVVMMENEEDTSIPRFPTTLP
jgi:hypothetical protein